MDELESSITGQKMLFTKHETIDTELSCINCTLSFRMHLFYFKKMDFYRRSLKAIESDFICRLKHHSKFK